MNLKLATAVVAGFLPLVAMGVTTNVNASASQSVVSKEIWPLRLKLTCRSGAVVILDKAALTEDGLGKEGVIPQLTGTQTAPGIRLNLLDGGTVTILWDDIEKITVGDRVATGYSYQIEVALRNVKGTKVGQTYGNNNTLTGQSDAGEFSIELKDVKEIVVLTAP